MHAYNLISVGDSVKSSIRKEQSELSTASLTSNRIRTALTMENVDFNTQACMLRLKGRNIEENQYVKIVSVVLRYLKGNWFSYWAHEVGRPENDTSVHFNQIKLQSFVGHSNSISSLYVLDYENNFMSGSRDKTVASCDSVVHLWDSFMGAIVGQLDSQKYYPVNVVKSMPSPCNLIFAATTERTIKVIDARMCKYIYDLKLTLNLSGLIHCLAIGPNGRAHESEILQIVVVDNDTLVSSGLDQNVNVWNVHDGKLTTQHTGATEPFHCLHFYEYQELISGTTANRIGVHSEVSPEASYNCTKLQTDTFKGLMTAMGVLPLNQLLLLGSDNGQISLFC
ncbi:hypothetical protein ABEB36_012467 [Hypothenemus hampei]|uniref:Pelota N-terminal domain-containing protein n=1 Tax=Hypothenemus hampei TaxID=57062 RepID=A0ABD1EBB7_HYPHA